MQAANREPRIKAGPAIAVATLCVAALLASLLIGEKAGAADATASKSATVRMQSFQFKPGSLSVSKGTRVIFANASGVPHNATLAGSFATGKIKPGKAVAVKFTAKGTYRYRCTIHPDMRGKIIVG
ncbi:MAG TPA: plastocyanin/azurin family copper-binding protein [Solirubrobacterales bacterium]